VNSLNTFQTIKSIFFLGTIVDASTFNIMSQFMTSIDPILLTRYNRACTTYSYTWNYYQELLHTCVDSDLQNSYPFKSPKHSQFKSPKPSTLESSVAPLQSSLTLLDESEPLRPKTSSSNINNGGDDDDDEGPVIYSSRRGRTPAVQSKVDAKKYTYTAAAAADDDDDDNCLDSMLSNMSLRDAIQTTTTRHIRSSSTPPKISTSLVSDEKIKEDNDDDDDKDTTKSIRKFPKTTTSIKKQPPRVNLREGEIDPLTGRVYVIEETEESTSTSSLLSSTSSSSSLPSASSFRSKKHREELTASLFREYNQQVFQNRLPADMKIEWDAHKRTTAGMTYMKRMTVATKPSEANNNSDSATSDGFQTTSLTDNTLSIVYVARIELSLKVVDSPFRLAQTLLHELCHAAAWILDHVDKPPHGPAFGKWAARASKSYPKRAVTVCHNFEIKYKYHYKCQRCGTSIGRFSKSIKDTDRCARGGCMGRLELVVPLSAVKVTRGDGGGDIGIAITASRIPSAYQTFCSNNRPKVVAANPGMNQRDIMKELARRWQEEKKNLATPAQKRGPIEDGVDEDESIVIDLFSTKDDTTTTVFTLDEEEEENEVTEID
jgi:hypothetical protein